MLLKKTKVKKVEYNDLFTQIDEESKHHKRKEKI